MSQDIKILTFSGIFTSPTEAHLVKTLRKGPQYTSQDLNLFDYPEVEQVLKKFLQMDYRLTHFTYTGTQICAVLER